MRTQKKERGVTLVELLIAMMILLVGLVPMLRAFMFALRTGNRARKMMIATNLARDMAEEIRAQAFSEGYADYKNQSYKLYYPHTDTAQRFGLETGENADTTSTNGGRISVFDDADDYDSWCRGSDCGTSSVTALETFDGQTYDGSGGYPNYLGFTRRVRVRNVFPSFATQTSFNPYDPSDYENALLISRYDFENWSTLRFDSDGNDVTGKSSLKIIEITVSYQGPGVENVEIQDLSFITIPMTPPVGE